MLLVRSQVKHTFSLSYQKIHLGLKSKLALLLSGATIIFCTPYLFCTGLLTVVGQVGFRSASAYFFGLICTHTHLCSLYPMLILVPLVPYGYHPVLSSLVALHRAGATLPYHPPAGYLIITWVHLSIIPSEKFIPVSL